MEIIFLLIPVSVLLVFGIAVGFWWSVKNGQFDDLEGPGFKILMDDDRPVVEQASHTENHHELDANADPDRDQPRR